MKMRLKQHLGCNDRSNENKNVWITELKSDDLSPLAEIIEEVDNQLAQTRELHWIQFYLSEGEPLLNRSEVYPSARRAGRRSTDLEYAQAWKAWQLGEGPCPFRNEREIWKHLPKSRVLHLLLKKQDELLTHVNIPEMQHSEVSTKEV